MTEFLAFRGPDASGTWTDGPIGLGHALLRTTEESARESQPCTLDGQVWITADARVDAREQLRGKLEAEGRRELAAASDAELILNAYALWGAECTEHLLGDFAFAIWDGWERKLYCARDPLGVKSFYYAEVGKSLIFSNTLDCLRLHTDVSDELNDLAIADFLLFGWSQDPAASSFADIRRLPAAHRLIWSGNALRIERYWTLPVDGLVRYRRKEEYVERFRELFRAAVADRLRNPRAGVLMSGGLDSTSVAAIAKQVLSEREQPYDLRAYTVDYRPLFEDREGDYARLVADALGIPFHPLAGDRYAPYEGWEHLHKPEPVHEPLMALQVEQLREVARHSSVALSGDGGDIIFHSQSWPYLVSLFKRGDWIRLAREFGGYALSHGRFPPLLGGFRVRFRRWLGKPVEQLEYPVWLNRDLEARLSLPARWEQVHRGGPQTHPIHPKAHQILSSGFWASVFESEDPGVTGVPLEIRRPLFDLRLVKFVLSVPPVPWGADKEFLRVVMRGLLPDAVRLRPKTPLAGDPVSHLWKRRPGGLPPSRAELLARYVDMERVPAVKGTDSPDRRWLNLTPHSLNYWLQEALIQYKNRQTVEVHRDAILSDNSRKPEKALSRSETGRLRQPD